MGSSVPPFPPENAEPFLISGASHSAPSACVAAFRLAGSPRTTSDAEDAFPGPRETSSCCDGPAESGHVKAAVMKRVLEALASSHFLGSFIAEVNELHKMRRTNRHVSSRCERFTTSLEMF